jgi:hypothetical protein
LRSNLQPQIINATAQHHDLQSQIANLTLQIHDLRVQIGALRPQIASCNLQWVTLTLPLAIAAQTTALSPANSEFSARHEYLSWPFDRCWATTTAALMGV